METLAVVGLLCKLTGRIAITWYADAAAAGVAASPGISVPPLVLYGSIGTTKVDGFDPVRAIGCDNRYITHSVINPPPTAAGLTATECDGLMQDRRVGALVDRCGRG